MTDVGKSNSLLDMRVRIPANVVHRELPGETVILNLETGHYHGLNATGSAIVAAIDRGATPRDAASSIADEFGAPAAEVEQHVEDFCRALLDRGLIELVVD
jgi:hypothetical protein